MAENEARKKAQDESRKAVQEQRDERAKLTAEAAKRMESTQPTPTQEENDLAKVGVVVDKKEDDKSGPTVITTTVVANEPLSAHGHETAETREKVHKAQQARESGGYETRAARARE
jgi:hypothetical protein